jgi:two-component system chemotaxis response regulator CheB
MPPSLDQSLTQHGLKLLVIDDSAFMRSVNTHALKGLPFSAEIQTAPDGELGLQKILSWQPDLITLDIEMPKMTGIELLSALKEKLGDRHGEKLPNILMVSTLTKKGAQITFQALNLGAKDFLCKPESNGVDAIGNFEKELIDKAKALLESTVLRPASLSRPSQPTPSAAPAYTPQRPPMASSSLPGLFALPDAIRQQVQNRRSNLQTVIIASSTGGPRALSSIVNRFNARWNARFVLVQHMPPNFTDQFAENLGKTCPLNVREAQNNDTLNRGDLVIAPGGVHLVFQSATQLKLESGPKVQGVCPAADVTMMSAAAKLSGDRLICLVMTGMGMDGADGAKAMTKQGAMCFSQSAETCVVYGMPKAVDDRGLSQLSVPLDQIPDLLDAILEKI